VSYRRSAAVMGTIVSIEVVHPDHDTESKVDLAFEWFLRVESCCSRFEPASELSRLSQRIGTATPAGRILFETVQFALSVAEITNGAFDPTVGLNMESRGFNREHRTGVPVQTAIQTDKDVSYRDVRLDPATQTITLLRPLLLDLGAVAKGFAIDMAAHELAGAGDFAIDAGGDLYLGGLNSSGLPWAIGIRHPIQTDAVIETVHVSDRAVCTSGNYERGDHIVEPRSGKPANEVASVSVLAPAAMMADALATAAFVMGPEEGIPLLDRMGADGIIFTRELNRFATLGMAA